VAEDERLASNSRYRGFVIVPVRSSLWNLLFLPANFVAALLLAGIGFLFREALFHMTSSVRETLRDLFDIEVPQELEGAVERVQHQPRTLQKRRSCARCGSALVFGSQRCDSCERLGIPPASAEPRWEPPGDAPPIEFASHSTWAAPRSVPRRLLGPAVLRLKLAMGVLLLTAAGSIVLSAVASVAWFQVFSLAAAATDFVLLFAIRRKSIAALVIAIALTVVSAINAWADPRLGWLVSVVALAAASGLIQALPAIWQLRRADRRDDRQSAA